MTVQIKRIKGHKWGGKRKGAGAPKGNKNRQKNKLYYV